MFDLIIKNGVVIDGMGAPPAKKNIGVRGDRIESLELPDGAESKQVIDAADLYVCPGFIDTHSHSDKFVLVEPSAASKIFQGVTTEITGNCGASAAPLTGRYQLPSDWESLHFSGKWSSVAEYRTVLQTVGPAVNIAMLIGHNAIRAGIAGYENRPLSFDEMKAAKRLLDQALDEGGRGLSTGLIYPPGMFAGSDEITELAGVVASHGGIYASHIRSEGKKLLEAIDEAIGIGRGAGCRVQISHLKTAGRGNWHLVDAALEAVRSARSSGFLVTADRYPYTFSGTDLDVVFPDWAEEGGREEILKRLKDPVQRTRLRNELRAMKTGTYWDDVTVGTTVHSDNLPFRGMSITDIAKKMNMDPVDILLKIIELDEVRTGAFFKGMSEDNMLKILAEPYVMIGSDASVRAPGGVLGKDFPHPRAYGSFPRFLRMVLDGKLLSIEEAIHKMTGLPAATFELKSRGVIEERAFADIVIFDPERIRDTSTLTNPHSLAEGIDTVIVNGIPSILDGSLTGRRTGRFL